MTDHDLAKFIQAYKHDGDLREWFHKDPHAALRAYGCEHHHPSHVETVIANTSTETADFSRDYSGVNGDVFDHSINQAVNTHGGDFSQAVDDHSATASGDHAVAAAGGINGSTIVSGDGNTVGNGNVDGDGNVVGNNNQAVTGDHNTASFGSGAANSTHTGSVTIGDGGAFNTGSGTTAIDNSDNSLDNVGNDESDHSVSDSNNTHTDSSLHHSYNDTSDHSDNSDHSINHSYNDHSDHSDESDHSVSHSHNVWHH